jgi:hypothetical protein
MTRASGSSYALDFLNSRPCVKRDCGEFGGEKSEFGGGEEVRCQVARARQRIFNSIGSSSPRWAARRTAGIFEFAPYLTQRATKRCAAMDPLTIFITAMILITLLSLFYILTARPSNVSLNTHSGDSVSCANGGSSSSNVGAQEGQEWAPDGRPS